MQPKHINQHPTTRIQIQWLRDGLEIEAGGTTREFSTRLHDLLNLADEMNDELLRLREEKRE